MAILITFFITRSIVKPLNQAVAAADSIAIGDMNVTVDTNQKDETGLLLNSMKIMAGNIKNLVSELNLVTNAALDGKLDVRGNESNFKGEYKNIMHGFNSTLDSVIGPLNVAAEYVDRIAKGDIPAKIVDNYKGDFNEIKNNLNLLIDNFSKFINDSKNMIQSHRLGDIDAKINDNDFRGFYAEMVGGFNEVVAIHVNNLLNILNILKSYSEGDLTPTLEKLPGKQEIANKIVDQIKFNLISVIQQINSLINSSLDGNLTERGNANKFQGAYQEIIVGFNKMLDSVELPIKELEEILEKIEVNDFTQKIHTDYRGIWDKLKNSANLVIDNLMEIQAITGNISGGDLSKLNALKNKSIDKNDKLTPAFVEMMESINKLLDDVNSLSSAAIEGKLHYRIDNSHHFGEYQELVNGINHTIDKLIEPINEAGSVLEKIATGNLTVKMTGDYKGDNQKLKNSINELVDSFHQLVDELDSATNQLVLSSNEILDSSKMISSNSDMQESQVNEVAAAIEELSKTISENAQSATFTASSATKNGKIAYEGGAIVQDTIYKMRDIAKSVDKSSSKINELGASSQKISEIIEVINDIADQTNLLALNAAIEAARAGEQGRGFAVVADEVRKLAERTTLATKEIAGMIHSIQAETTEAVQDMETGSKEVSTGISFADKAGESLKQIVNSSQEVIDLINHIATATEEQSATSEEIAKVVESITHSIHSTNDNIKQIENLSSNLSSLTDHLQGLMSKFKIEKDNASMIGNMLPNRTSRKNNILHAGN